MVWRSPSSDASGAMPLGNGELGINLWVEPSGDLLFYLSRTDSWSETGRLLKLGKVRVSLSPNPFAAGSAFTQRLNLQEGTIEITGEQGKERTKLTVFADPGAPVLHLLCTSSRPVNVTAASEPWRTAPYDIPKEDSLLGINSAWPRTGTYDYTQAVESADQTLSDPDAVVWYHRNEHSTYPLTLDLMELHSLASRFDDPLLHRTFGMRMSGAGFVKRSPLEIATVRPVKHFDLRLATCTAQTPDIATWEQQLRATERSAANGRKALAANRQWWKNFWDKSFIFVETPDIDTGFRITQSYLLQNWMSACGGRGAYPIKFNGGIFTVDPVFTDAKIRANADHRNWGGDYWWQNTRLMYYPMLASGDFEMMLPLFRFYQDRLASFRTIASEYMDAEGAVIPETSSIFGLYRPGDYGWDRTGRQKGDIRNMYVRHAWNGSLELVSMMLDYYDYTGDTAFVRTRLVPVATEVLRYFDTKFPKDADGTIRITPTQALETYWYDMVNDLPCVAGLHAVLPRLLALPHGTAALPEQARWNRMQRQLPPMPVEIRDGQKRFAPAEQYDPKEQYGSTGALRRLPVRPMQFHHARRTNRNRHLQRPYRTRFLRLAAGRPDGRPARADRASRRMPRAQDREFAPESPFPGLLGAQFRLDSGPEPRRQPAHHPANYGPAKPRQQRLPAASISQTLERTFQVAHTGRRHRRRLLPQRKMGNGTGTERCIRLHVEKRPRFRTGA
ncbi:MAG: DUF5703 domain-containing protein [Alistipes indistinctus]